MLLRAIILSTCMLTVVGVRGQDCYDLSSNSSWITLACYFDDGRMLLRMQGTDYVFCSVPSYLFNGLVNSPSPGEYYSAYIRGRYGCSNGPAIDHYDTGPVITPR